MFREKWKKSLRVSVVKDGSGSHHAYSWHCIQHWHILQHFTWLLCPQGSLPCPAKFRLGDLPRYYYRSFLSPSEHFSHSGITWGFADEYTRLLHCYVPRTKHAECLGAGTRSLVGMNPMGWWWWLNTTQDLVHSEESNKICIYRHLESNYLPIFKYLLLVHTLSAGECKLARVLQKTINNMSQGTSNIHMIWTKNYF